MSGFVLYAYWEKHDARPDALALFYEVSKNPVVHLLIECGVGRN